MPSLHETQMIFGHKQFSSLAQRDYISYHLNTLVASESRATVIYLFGMAIFATVVLQGSLIFWESPEIFNVPAPVDSILEAVFTVSPKRQYRGIVVPTTPATTGPTRIKRRSITNSNCFKSFIHSYIMFVYYKIKIAISNGSSCQILWTGKNSQIRVFTAKFLFRFERSHFC